MEKILLNITKMLTSRKFLNEENLEANYQSLVKQINEERTFKIKSDYDSSKFFHILFVYGKLTTIKKIQGLETFLQKSKGQNRIFIANNINQKAYKQFKELNNTEVFFEYELQINLIDHDLQPVFEVLNEEEKEKFMAEYQVTKKQMSKMKSIDPIARYYNSKAGDIFRIIRPSTSAGVGIHYRIVIDANVSDIFVKK